MHTMDQDASNTTFVPVAPWAATSAIADTFNKMAESIRNHQVQEVALLFREKTCPGDWKSWDITYGSILGECVKGERPNKLPNPDPKKSHEKLEIAASVQFRWGMGLFTDVIIKNFGLPAPRGQHCLFWREYLRKKPGVGEPSMKDRIIKLGTRLLHEGFIVRPKLEQGPEFIRPCRYVTTAILEANLPEQEEVNVIGEIVEIMRQYRGITASQPEARDGCIGMRVILNLSQPLPASAYDFLDPCE
ncbi:hypothetical protein F5B18DRAFT_667795 [Nemania serpens]|nr:hypothetical protein F5B18DRAFT_667795 [Nemania serpens]